MLSSSLILKPDKRNAVSSFEYSLSPCPDDSDPLTAGSALVEASPALSAALPAASCWWLYMVRMADGRLYTGISTDVARRFSQHVNGKGARALRGKGPLALVWQQQVGAHSVALKLEYRLKRWRKARKEALINSPMLFAELQAQLESEYALPT
ncbi:GIY-YIG nuclease superfamily protein [Plesiomonas shigelloides]|nr:GIY-YIG nuclease superfamily protein [Plesiomonas shigelloides]